MNDKKHEFWNERASLGHVAGSNDFILKELEIRQLTELIPTGADVLDIGCGNGDTLVHLAKEKKIKGTGVDFAENMVALAQTSARNQRLDAHLRFLNGKVPGLPAALGTFDTIITERCLINLDGEAAQKQAFDEIIGRLKPGGRYLMMESFIEGLDRTNELRARFGLEKILPPWHNTFFHEQAVANWASDRVHLAQVIPYSSTYHFLSRVIYAKVAAERGEPLRYDSDINVMSLKLPIVGDFGPARLYVWERLV